MSYNFNIVGLVLFSTALMSLLVGFVTWQRRRYLAAKILTCMLISIFIYCFSSAMQAGITELSANILWAKISYIGYVWLTPFCFIFTKVYTNQWSRINIPTTAGIGIIPMITLILVWTNDFHGLIWSSFEQGDQNLNIIIFNHGIWFWIFMFFQLCLYAITLIILVDNLIHIKKPYQQQSYTILIATLLPAVAGLIYALNLSPITGLDWMPISIFLTSLLFFLGLFQFRLLDLVPVARATLIEQMNEGMMVLDESRRIIDINPIARKMLTGGFKIKIGDCIEILQPELRNILTEAYEQSQLHGQAFREFQSDYGFLELRSTFINRGRSKTGGSLIIFMDITKRKMIEESLNQAKRELEDQLKNIQDLQNKLREESIRDPLTNLYNRRYLEDALQREFARARRNQYPSSIIMVDVDYFKRVNDTYGHHTGDIVLQEIAKILIASFRQEDIISRYGGEEFLIVMPATSIETAHTRAEILRNKIETTQILVTGQKIQLTISAGVATFPSVGTTIHEVIKSADQALFRAKSMGRNRVVIDDSLNKTSQVTTESG